MYFFAFFFLQYSVEKHKFLYLFNVLVYKKIISLSFFLLTFLRHFSFFFSSSFLFLFRFVNLRCGICKTGEREFIQDGGY